MSLLKIQAGTKEGVRERVFSRRGRDELQKQHPDLTKDEIRNVVREYAGLMRRATEFSMFQTWVDRDLRELGKKKQETA